MLSHKKLSGSPAALHFFRWKKQQSHAGVQCGGRWGGTKAGMQEGMSLLSHVPVADVMKSLGEKGVGGTNHTGDFSGSIFSSAPREGLKMGETEGRLEHSKGKRNLENHVSYSSTVGYWFKAQQ